MRAGGNRNVCKVTASGSRRYADALAAFLVAYGAFVLIWVGSGVWLQMARDNRNQAFYNAISNWDEAATRDFLKAGADAKRPQEDIIFSGMRPLAMLYEVPTMIRLTSGPFHMPPKYRDDPVRIARLLLDAGADPNLAYLDNSPAIVAA